MSRTQSCRYPLKVKLYQTVHLVGQVFRRPLERFRFLAEEDDLLLTTDSVQDVQDFVLPRRVTVHSHIVEEKGT